MIVSVSIVIHDTPRQMLAEAVACVLRSHHVAKLFVIDNSRKPNPGIEMTSDPRVEYIHVVNHGFGAGNNVAIKKILDHSKYHLVMNPDVKWDGDVIGKIISYMETHPHTGLLGPRTLNPDGTLQDTCRMLPTPFDLFLRRFLPGFICKGKRERYLLRHLDHNRTIECSYLLGCFMFFRTRALKECGMFDERFFMYMEDIDITRRIHEKWDTVYWPGVTIIHQHARQSARNVRMFAIHLRNAIRYFNKWGWEDCNDKSVSQE